MLALVLLAVPLTGCAADQDDGTMEPVTVEWVQQPQDMDTGQAIDVTWQLDGAEREIQHTGLHWADTSVSDPQSPADYGNSSGVEEPAQVPGEYTTTVTLEDEGTYHFRAHAIVDGEHVWTSEVEIEVEESGAAEPPVLVSVDDHTADGTVNETLRVNWSLSGAPDEVQHTGFHWADFNVSDPESPADYGNSSGVVEPADVPGSYNATFTEEEPGAYFGRAHAIYDGQHYWSDEIRFRVQTADDGTGDVTHHVVEIETFQFQPGELTVQPGDTINWTNLDDVTHTATFQDTENGTDSGDIAPGGYYNWTVPEDTPEGTYEYVCEYHATMMGEVTVEAADGG